MELAQTLRSETFGEIIEGLDKTLWQLFSSTAATHPESDALVSMWQHDLGAETGNQAIKYLRWSYGDLYRRSLTLANWLGDNGCHPGSRVAAFLWNSAEWSLFLWASARIGAVFVPLDPRSLNTDAEMLLEGANPTIIVVQDTEAAKTLSLKPAQIEHLVRIQCSGDPVPGWVQLNGILTNDFTALDEMSTPSPSRASPADPALLIFTSGTTNAPKGCPHTHTSLVAQSHQYDPNQDPTIVDRWLVHTPVSHIFAVNNAIRAWRLGNAVVFPSKAFDVQATLQALVQEQCTFMSAVPTLVKGLLANPAFPGKEALNIKLVTIGGTVITPEDIGLCLDGLGAAHAVQAYGMSEGAPVISWLRTDPLLAAENGYHAGVGKALPGVNIRICAPGSRKPLARGEVGELHIGGPPVITEYLHGVEPETFYVDGAGSWLFTGDQARMDEDGVIYIMGRYKDLIIRGGENISPIKIETTIQELDGVLAQVVGVPDELAGQVPVAVVKLPEEVSTKDVVIKVRQLGPMYALDGVYTLWELGMEAFPMTSLGKVKKEALKQAVLKLRMPVKPSAEEATLDEDLSLSARGDHENVADIEGGPQTQKVRAIPLEKSSGSLQDAANERNHIDQDSVVDIGNLSPSVLKLADQLALIWEDLVGEKPGLHDSTSMFADSITLLRFCDRVFQTLGRRIYIDDLLVDDETLAKQAILIHKRPVDGLPAEGVNPVELGNFYSEPAIGGITSAQHSWTTSRSAHGGGPPTAQDTTANSGLLPAAISAITAAGLGPSVLESILPIKKNFHSLAAGPRPQSYHTRILFRTHFSTANIQAALQSTLAAHPIFRTLIAHHPSTQHPFHVVLKPSIALFNSTIQVLPPGTDIFPLATSGSDASHSSPFTARFLLLLLSETPPTSPGPEPTSYILATYSHSVFDALSINSFHNDLSRQLTNPSLPLPPLTPFALYTSLLANYAASVPAQIAVQENIRRLQGISRFPSILWPPQRAPGWYMGSDDPDVVVSPTCQRSKVRDQVWSSSGGWTAENAAKFEFARVRRIISLPGIGELGKRFGARPKEIMRTAIAIFNVLRTGERYAAFVNAYVGRRWPFVLEWMAERLPPPGSVDGPMMEWAVEFLEVVRKGESVGKLVERMVVEAREVENFVQAPWEEVAKGLGVEEGIFAEGVGRRQCFVWDVTLAMMGDGEPEAALKAIGRWDWPDW